LTDKTPSPLTPTPLPEQATVYTHLGQGINVLRDPPKSPLKKGDFESGSPFFKGGWGGSNPVEARSEDSCVHGSPEQERGFEPRLHF